VLDYQTVPGWHHWRRLVAFFAAAALLESNRGYPEWGPAVHGPLWVGVVPRGRKPGRASWRGIPGSRCRGPKGRPAFATRLRQHVGVRAHEEERHTRTCTERGGEREREREREESKTHAIQFRNPSWAKVYEVTLKRLPPQVRLTVV
jgi:hypothetical protein